MSPKQLFKTGVLKALNIQAWARARPLILMYHSVGSNAAKFTVSPEAFDAQLRALGKSGYRILSLEELTFGLATYRNDKVAAITFDDGFKDFRTTALPVLERHQLTADVFVITSRLGGEFCTSDRAATLPLMDRADLEDVLSRGTRLHPHSATHVDLDKVGETEARLEIEASISSLEAMLGKRPTIFSYPRGFYNTATLSILAEQGIDYAVTTRKGYLDPGVSPLLLPRVGISSNTTIDEFQVILNGHHDTFEGLVQWIGDAKRYLPN